MEAYISAEGLLSNGCLATTAVTRMCQVIASRLIVQLHFELHAVACHRTTWHFVRRLRYVWHSLLSSDKPRPIRSATSSHLESISLFHRSRGLLQVFLSTLQRQNYTQLRINPTTEVSCTRHRTSNPTLTLYAPASVSIRDPVSVSRSRALFSIITSRLVPFPV